MCLTSNFTYIDWINKLVKGKEEYLETIEYNKNYRVDKNECWPMLTKVLYKFDWKYFGNPEILEHDLKLILKRDGLKCKITYNNKWLKCLVYIVK